MIHTFGLGKNVEYFYFVNNNKNYRWIRKQIHFKENYTFLSPIVHVHFTAAALNVNY